ncbi:PREDICTED: putative phosphatidate phosphatase [Ceratosolen solmsi marchali]|uniref:Phosphatidate phosphatase n=1 Tax=Ceratosolen solmsi marchali TaxID=326594 RepID=A0AAJ6YHD7_9HYME|nr:PREDICTED: putative phosphatidate phosphatase [Ceratosolen solmsi marchali]
MTVLILYHYAKPYERGFFCNDESLNHPFHISTVTSPMLYVTGVFLPICTILLFEYNYSKNIPDTSSLVIFGYTIPLWVYMAYSKIGVFGFGAGITALTTDIAKYTVGRLRPHFMTLCKPNIDCTQAENQHRYFENFTCTAIGVSDKLLKELRLSFPSGHSSFSAYTMIYLALYLQLRLTWKGSKLLRHFLQFICIMMAWFTAMTRISNYKHHWSDVLAGSTIGTVIAFIMVFVVADLFKEQRLAGGCTYKQQQSEEKTTEYEGAAPSHHMQVNNGTDNRIC